MRPMPLICSVTRGSPRYSILPAPEIDACSVCSTLTTTLPTPLTRTVASRARKPSALNWPAPEMRTSARSTCPAIRASSAPEPSTRSDVARRSSIASFAPPDAAMRSAGTSILGACTSTEPLNRTRSSVGNRTVMRGGVALRR